MRGAAQLGVAVCIQSRNFEASRAAAALAAGELVELVRREQRRSDGRDLDRYLGEAKRGEHVEVLAILANRGRAAVPVDSVLAGKVSSTALTIDVGAATASPRDIANWRRS